MTSFKTDLCSGSNKYSDKDNGGMLVWSPYHTIVDTKRKFTFFSSFPRLQSSIRFSVHTELTVHLPSFCSGRVHRYSQRETRIQRGAGGSDTTTPRPFTRSLAVGTNYVFMPLHLHSDNKLSKSKELVWKKTVFEKLTEPKRKKQPVPGVAQRWKPQQRNAVRER